MAIITESTIWPFCQAEKNGCRMRVWMQLWNIIPVQLRCSQTANECCCELSSWCSQNLDAERPKNRDDLLIDSRALQSFPAKIYELFHYSRRKPVFWAKYSRSCCEVNGSFCIDIRLSSFIPHRVIEHWPAPFKWVLVCPNCNINFVIIEHRFKPILYFPIDWNAKLCQSLVIGAIPPAYKQWSGSTFLL